MPTQSDLFARLFKYRTSDRQRHVENFLTEILRELLNRLVAAQPSVHLAFVRDLLLADCAEKPDRLLTQIEAAGSTLCWESQWPISHNGSPMRPDLVLFDGNRPLLVVEDKVNARLGKANGRSDVDEDNGDNNEREATNQLQSYGRWLRRKNCAGGLVYLTHAVATLPVFENENYGVKICAIAQWIQVREWLSSKLKTNNPVVHYLAEQLRAFLESEGIRQMEQRDIDLLEKFFRQRAKLTDPEDRLQSSEDSLVEAMKAARQGLKADGLAWGQPKYSWAALLCWGNKQGLDLLLSFGFTHGTNKGWSPDRRPSDNEGLKRELLAFVGVGMQDRESPFLPQLRNWGNEKDEGEWLWFINYRRATDLLNEPGGFTPAFVSWVRGELTNALGNELPWP